MQEEMQIKAAMKACIHDLRRERDKVQNTMGQIVDIVHKQFRVI